MSWSTHQAAIYLQNPAKAVKTNSTKKPRELHEASGLTCEMNDWTSERNISGDDLFTKSLLNCQAPEEKTPHGGGVMEFSRLRMQLCEA